MVKGERAMSVFAISDLHLSTSDKSKDMAVFGGRWNNYIEKLVKNWNAVVSPGDSVIIPGDISWATGLENSINDLKFVDSLNGTKYIGKGNHDLWWATYSKMIDFFNQNEISTIKVLYNNAYLIENTIVCGTRGWFYDEKTQKTPEPVDYAKLINREVTRLELSILAAKKLQEQNCDIGIKVFFHFPPIFDDYICRELVDTLHKYKIAECYYGHIHGNYAIPFNVTFEGISFRIISADYLGFVPYLIR